MVTFTTPWWLLLLLILAARAAAPVAWSTGAAHEGTSASAEEFTHRMRAPSSQ